MFNLLDFWPAPHALRKGHADMPTPYLKPFTVLAVLEDSFRIYTIPVMAKNALNAFAAAATLHEALDLIMVVALEGHQSEHKELTFPGEGRITPEFILGESDVYGTV